MEQENGTTSALAKKVQEEAWVGKIMENPASRFFVDGMSIALGFPILSPLAGIAFGIHAAIRQQALTDLMLATHERVKALEKFQKSIFEERVSQQEGYTLSVRVLDAVLREPNKAEMLAKYFVNSLGSELSYETISSYMDVVEQLRPLDIKILEGCVLAKRKNNTSNANIRYFTALDVESGMPKVDSGVFQHSLRKLETLGLLNKNNEFSVDATHFLTVFGENIYDYFSK